MQHYLERIFKLQQHQTSIRIELLAGLTTFLTMAYIIFVNPLILATSGMEQGAVFTATCLISAFATLLSALIANSPIAIAPGMALNTVFAFVVVQSHGYDWQNALGMVFISGLLFILLTITKVRSLLVKALPECMNTAIIVGIALLIALIALKTNKIIVVSDSAFLELGNLASWPFLLFSLGFLLIILLDHFKIPGAILIGILIISILSLIKDPNLWHGVFSLPPSITPTFMKLKFNQLNTPHAYHQIFSFLLIALFDATGTLVGLLHTPVFRGLSSNKKIEGALLSDSLATTGAALLGSSSTSPFIESATGINVGGRTGLTSLVTAVLFISALFFSPLVHLIPSYAIGSALLYIACCIMKDITNLNTTDITEFAPAVVTILMIPFSFSIADGIGMGLISYTFLKLLTKQYRALNPTLMILSAVFLFYFFYH